MADDVMRCVLAGDLEGLRAAVAGGADLEQIDGRGHGPLSRAVLRGREDMVVVLLEAGASPDSPNRPRGKMPPLSVAAQRANVGIAERLLDAGASVGEAEAGGWTALYRAAMGESGDHLRLVRFLLDRGADVRAPPGTVLPVACMSGSPQIVRALLVAGAEVNANTTIGTPLIKAVEWNRPRTVELLLAAGADPSIPAAEDYPSHAEHRGRTPLDIATMRGLTHLQRLLEGKPRDDRIPSPGAVPAFWIRIELFQQSGRAGGPLLGPASEDDIQAVEKACGLSLPDDVKKSYRRHDGQPERAAGTIPRFGVLGCAYRLLPLASVLMKWRGFDKYRHQTVQPDGRIGADPGVRAKWWLPAWIPFAGNGLGDYLMIDLDPAPGGRHGQVITFDHEKHTHYLVAPSMSAFLRDLADALAANAAQAARPVWP